MHRLGLNLTTIQKGVLGSSSCEMSSEQNLLSCQLETQFLEALRHSQGEAPLFFKPPSESQQEIKGRNSSLKFFQQILTKIKTICFLLYHKSSAKEGISAVPPTCCQGRLFVELSSLLKGTCKSILEPNDHYSSSATSTQKRNVPGMERAKSKTATNIMMGFIIQ